MNKLILFLFLIFLPLSSYSQEQNFSIEIKEKTLKIKYFIYEEKYWIVEKINDNQYLLTKGIYDYILNISEDEIILLNIQTNKTTNYGNLSAKQHKETNETETSETEHHNS